MKKLILHSERNKETLTIMISICEVDKNSENYNDTVLKKQQNELKFYKFCRQRVITNRVIPRTFYIYLDEP